MSKQYDEKERKDVIVTAISFMDVCGRGNGDFAAVFFLIDDFFLGCAGAANH